MRRGLIICLSIIFSIHLSYGQDVNYDSGNNGRKLDWALYYLTNHYVDSTDNDYLTEVALRAIVRELDPFSSYHPPKKAKEQFDRDRGVKEEGIGIRYYMLVDTAIITNITGGSTAEKAGIKRGDQILAIDGTNVIDYSWDDINDLLSGETDTEVTLSLLRAGDFAFDISLPRGPVPYESVVSAFMLDDKTMYLKLDNFNRRTLEEFETHTRAMQPKQFVIDLRDNTGGVLNASVDLANQFLDRDQLILYSQGYNLERKEYYATGNGKYKNAPVIILVDNNTMSASEIFTAALQDHDRCLIIGTNTYGKALIQQSYKLGDGSTIRLTIGRYYTPSGRLIQRPYDMDEDWLTTNEKKAKNTFLTSSMDVPDEYQSKTLNNRSIISGHGGIAPDMYMEYYLERDDYYNLLNDNGLVYGFVTWYLHTHRERLLKLFPNPSSFNESDGLQNEIDYAFTKYVERKNKAWDLDLELKPIPTTPRTMKQIKSWMGTQLWGTSAYHQIRKSEDSLIQRAIEVLNNGTFQQIGLR